MAQTNKWIQQQASISIDPNIPKAVGVMGSMLEVYTEFLDLLKSGLTILAATDFSGPSVISQTLTKFLNEISDIIDSYTKPTSVHALIVPPALRTNLDWKDTVLSSIEDKYDDARPIYTKDESVAGLIILAYYDTLAPDVSSLDLLLTMKSYAELFNLTSELNWDSHVYKAPADFRAKLISKIYSDTDWIIKSNSLSKTPYAIKLEWDPPNEAELASITEDDPKISELNIYRSIGKPFPSRMSRVEWDEFLYDTKPINYLNKELSVYLDMDIEENTTYYYALSYNYKLGSEEIKDAPVTNWVRVKTTKEPVLSRRSSPPRWVATHNPLKYWPALDKAVFTLKETIKKNEHISTNSNSQTELLNKQIDTLTEIINQQNKIADKLKSVQTTITGILDLNIRASVGLYPFISKGGTSGIRAAIFEAFDESKGIKLSSQTKSAGIMLVTGGQTSANIELFKSIISLVSGGNFNVFDEFSENAANFSGEPDVNIDELLSESKTKLQEFKNKLHSQP